MWVTTITVFVWFDGLSNGLTNIIRSRFTNPERKRPSLLVWFAFLGKTVPLCSSSSFPISWPIVFCRLITAASASKPASWAADRRKGERWNWNCKSLHSTWGSISPWWREDNVHWRVSKLWGWSRQKGQSPAVRVLTQLQNLVNCWDNDS